jgi:simple sugar transport system ATP-binding protein
VFSLADRIAVMYRGKIMDIVPPDTSREDVGLLMAGVHPGDETSEAPGEQAVAEEETISEEADHE